MNGDLEPGIDGLEVIDGYGSGVDSEPLARRLELRVRLLARVVRVEAPYGISISALLVLSTLQYRGPSRVTYLAEITDVTQPTMTTLIGRLEKSGLVTRRRDAKDGRAMEVTITEEGARRIKEVVAMRAAVLEKRLQLLGLEQLEQLEAALTPLAELAGLSEGEDEEALFHRA